MQYRALPFVLAFAVTAVSAQVSQEDHSAHHPDGGAPPAAAAPAPTAGPAGSDRYAEQMKQMQDMHARLQAAKTPAERRALMDEHLKLMQSGMDMMAQAGGMGMGMGMGMQGGTAPGMPAAPGSPPAGAATPPAGPGMGGMMGQGMMGMHGAMERRMAMMETMMQMMVDREAATAGK